MEIEQAILRIDPSFQVIVNPKFDPKGEIQTADKVWGRVIQAGITLRIAAVKDKILICFVKKATNHIGVTQIRSTRWTTVESLEKCLFEWKFQFEKENIVCNKCTDGFYEFIRFGQEVQGKCNRCRGKGWQDYDDQLANEKYDYVMKNQANYNMPHWKPY